MKLRMLKKEDAIYMLEWMHDKYVVENMQTIFTSKTLKDCEQFIALSQKTKSDLHLAIVNDSDLYMGTVSLKHIHHNIAEFAIAVRREAMGKGYAKFGMEQIIQIGFEKLHLKSIYWCVSKNNSRALRFYDKNKYHRVKINELHIENTKYTKQQMEEYIWYEIKKDELKEDLLKN